MTSLFLIHDTFIGGIIRSCEFTSQQFWKPKELAVLITCQLIGFIDNSVPVFHLFSICKNVVLG